jgi:hypothetical protein
MPTFEAQADGTAIIRHDDGTVEPVAPGDVAARYAELAGGRGQDIDEARVLQALRKYAAGQSSSVTTQLPESLTHTCCPSE